MPNNRTRMELWAQAGVACVAFSAQVEADHIEPLDSFLDTGRSVRVTRAAELASQALADISAAGTLGDPALTTVVMWGDRTDPVGEFWGAVRPADPADLLNTDRGRGDAMGALQPGQLFALDDRVSFARSMSASGDVRFWGPEALPDLARADPPRTGGLLAPADFDGVPPAFRAAPGSDGNVPADDHPDMSRNDARAVPLPTALGLCIPGLIALLVFRRLIPGRG